MPRAKIGLLYVGGSIGMKVNQKTGRIDPIESLNGIYQFLPELQKEVSLEFFSVANVGSSDITPEHWVQIAETIRKEYNKFEGFVVIHGTNTMSYTAAALSFALQGLSKPIILTGAMVPINELAGDGRMNLVYALKAAQLDIAEVCVVMGPTVLRGTRAKKVEQSILQSFDSPKFPPLAEFSREVTLHPNRIVRRKRTLDCKPTFDSNVELITLHPGITEAFLDAVLQAQPSGIVVRAYGPGMLAESIFPWVRRVTEAGIPMVFTSQTVRGKVDLHRYRKQLTLEKLGVMSGKNMSFECAMVKLMWSLTQAKNPRRLREMMEKSLVGELEE